MRKYYALLKNYFSSALEYRANLFGFLLMELISMGSIVILWFSIYSQQSTVGGYNLNQIIQYYIYAPLVGYITYIDISYKIADEIRTGFLSTHLLKPQVLWIHQLMAGLGRKFNTLLVILPFYSLLLFVIDLFFPLDVTFSNIILALCVGIIGFIFNFCLDLIFGNLAFWMNDIWWFRHFKTFVFGILAGLSFPYIFLPLAIQKVLLFLPFQFVYYAPITLLLRTHTQPIIFDFLVGIFWIMVTFSISQIMWKKGVKNYEAFGN